MDKSKFRMAVACLLHDIGKLYERSQSQDRLKWGENKAQGSGLNYRHCWFTDEFFEEFGKRGIALDVYEGGDDSIRMLAKFHHAPRETAMHLALRKADVTDAAQRQETEEREGSDENIHTVVLRSVFDAISLDAGKGSTGKVCSYEIKPLGQWFGEESVPRAGGQPVEHTEAYKLLLESFYQGLLFIDRYRDNGILYVNLLDSLAERCMGLVSDSARKGERHDISLYDHSRMTAALALALAADGLIEEKPLLLTGVDMNGIQKFIYRITEGQGVGHTAKRLRSRSYLVSSLTEGFAQLLLRSLGLPRLSLLYCGGGGFLLLCGHSAENIKKIEQARVEYEEWLFKEFEGDLSLNCVTLAATREEFSADYAGLTAEIGQRLVRNKWKKHPTLVGKADFLAETTNAAVKSSCRSCGKLVEEARGPVCNWCQKQVEMGGWLTRAKSLAWYAPQGADPLQKTKISLGPAGEIVLDGRGESLSQAEYFANWSQDGEKIGRPLVYLVPQALADIQIDREETISKGEALSFRAIAECARGDAKLGVLRMDMDNLGLIFSQGLDEGLRTPSRLATLSRMLDRFFSVGIERILRDRFNEWKRKEEAPAYYQDRVDQIFYLCYSGGDDLFVIGPASEMPGLALAVRDELKKFAGYNPFISASAGLVFASPTQPVAILAEESERELKQAKDTDKPEIKDRIAIFGQAIGFEKFREIYQIAEEWAAGIMDEKIPRTFIYWLMEDGRRALSDREAIDYNIITRINYRLSRNIKDKDTRKALKAKLVTEDIMLLNEKTVSAGLALMMTRNKKR